jgi:hypothetical protein
MGNVLMSFHLMRLYFLPLIILREEQRLLGSSLRSYPAPVVRVSSIGKLSAVCDIPFPDTLILLSH